MSAICSRALAEQPVAPALTHVEIALQGARTAQRGHQWPEALKLYREVWTERKTYDVAANMAKVELQFNEYRSAVEHLTYALENMPGDVPESARVTVQQLVEIASPNLGKVLLSVERGTTIRVDGVPREDWLSRSVLYLDSGPHTISVNRPGYDAVERAITVRNGESIPVTIALPLKSSDFVLLPPRPEYPAQTSKPASPRESRAPDQDETVLLFMGGGMALTTLGIGISYLSLADRSRQDVDILKASCPEGCLEVDLMQNDVNLNKTLALASFVEAGVAGTGGAIVWALLRNRNRRHVQRGSVPLILGGTLAGSGIVTGVLLLRSASSHDAAAQAQANTLTAGGHQNFCAPGTLTLFDCMRVLEEREAAQQKRSLAIASFSVAGAMLAGTVGYYFWSTPKEGSATAVWPVAVADAHGATIGLHGAF